MRRAFLPLALLLAAACPPAAAQNMKPGLWEMNNKMSGGQMDKAMVEMQKAMAGMSPAERKQMEEMMARQGVKMMPSAGGMTVQMCMTKEMVERNDMPMQDGCKVTRNDRSGNKVKFAFTCSNPPSSGEGETTFAPETYTSHMTMKSVVNGKPETTTMNGTGKWLKADCGNVKPVQLPAKK